MPSRKNTSKDKGRTRSFRRRCGYSAERWWAKFTGLSRTCTLTPDHKAEGGKGYNTWIQLSYSSLIKTRITRLTKQIRTLWNSVYVVHGMLRKDFWSKARGILLQSHSDGHVEHNWPNWPKCSSPLHMAPFCFQKNKGPDVKTNGV